MQLQKNLPIITFNVLRHLLWETCSLISKRARSQFLQISYWHLLKSYLRWFNNGNQRILRLLLPRGEKRSQSRKYRRRNRKIQEVIKFFNDNLQWSFITLQYFSSFSEHQKSPLIIINISTLSYHFKLCNKDLLCGYQLNKVNRLLLKKSWNFQHVHRSNSTLKISSHNCKQLALN